MNTSDNPGLWDIQFSSSVFCEFNATVKSLFNWLVLGFRASHDVREDGFLLASAADFRSPHSGDQRQFGRLLVRQAPHKLSLSQAIH